MWISLFLMEKKKNVKTTTNSSLGTKLYSVVRKGGSAKQWNGNLLN